MPIKLRIAIKSDGYLKIARFVSCVVQGSNSEGIPYAINLPDQKNWVLDEMND